jgi:hypothetical protein
MAEHVAVYCQRPLAWDWQKRVCGLPNYVKETVERVEPCRLSYGSFWREADVRHNGQVGYLAAPAPPFLETSTLTGTP